MSRTLTNALLPVATLLWAASPSCKAATDGDVIATTLEFVSAVPFPDTSGAPEETLIVEARDSAGRVIPDVLVVFESFSGEPASLGLTLRSLDGVGAPVIIDSTNADGQAGVLISRGIVAGTAWLKAAAPAFDLVDSVAVTILPGQPYEIRLSPNDTAVHLDRTITIQAHIADRHGNRTDAAVSFASESSAVAVEGVSTVRGLEYGRGEILATGAGLHRSAWISVVPEATLAVLLRAFAPGDSVAIALVSTDGSGFNPLWALPFDDGSTRPFDWAPDGQSLVLHVERSVEPGRLFRLGVGGVLTRLIPESSGSPPEVFPRHGGDGWIYFSARVDRSNGTDELWRVRPDGTLPQRVGAAASARETDTYPAPSPDGLHVWFSTDRPSPGVFLVTLARLTVATGAVDYLGAYGVGAVWSPLGDRVAFVDLAGAVTLMAPDGAGHRVVSRSGRTYEPYLNWSPDGRWIVAAGPAGIDVIEPDAGLSLPLAFSTKWRHPAWRP